MENKVRKNYYTARNSQIGQYFQDDLNFVSYDLTDENTWNFLNETENLFLIVPTWKAQAKRKEQNVSRTILDDCKKFIFHARQSGVKKIVKIGSLGPNRAIHRQIDQFIELCDINYTTFEIAPLMNNVVTEMYKDGILYNYRGNTPAPYVDTKVLTEAVVQAMDRDDLKNLRISATGEKQYYIEDVKRILIENNYPVTDIVTQHNDTFIKNSPDNVDQQLVSDLGKDYFQGWYPEVSSDINDLFGIQSRSLEQFMMDEKKILARKY
jgi:hypothetical protein